MVASPGTRRAPLRETLIMPNESPTTSRFAPLRPAPDQESEGSEEQQQQQQQQSHPRRLSRSNEPLPPRRRLVAVACDNCRSKRTKVRCRIRIRHPYTPQGPGTILRSIHRTNKSLPPMASPIRLTNLPQVRRPTTKLQHLPFSRRKVLVRG